MIDGTKIDYFPRILALVKEAFPDFSDGAVRHTANCITNELRKSRVDCYAIEVSPHIFGGDPGYFHEFEVSASARTVFVRVTVD